MMGFGVATERDEGEPKEALEISLGWTNFGVEVEEVVALRLRRVAGGD